MRCYRCGALMDYNTDTCPSCGFFLYSPVEIRMYKDMQDIRIYDSEKTLLWTGDENETAYIDAPDRRNIRICWSLDYEIWISVKNGEAYRFDNTYSRMGKRKGDASLIKTRTIPKKGKKSISEAGSIDKEH